MTHKFNEYPGTILTPEVDIRIEFSKHMHDIIVQRVLNGFRDVRLRIDGTIRCFALPPPEQILDFVCMRDVGVRRGRTRISVVHLLIPEYPTPNRSAAEIEDSYYYQEFSYAVSDGAPEDEWD